MLFEIKYKQPLTRKKVMALYGPGAIHLLDHAVVFEGWRPDYAIPWVSQTFYFLVCDRSMWTVPYDWIRRHRQPTRPRGVHELYIAMGSAGYSLFFTLKHNSQDFGAELSRRISQLSGIERPAL